MGRKKLEIMETRVKNLPYIDGEFQFTDSNGNGFTVNKVSVPTGKRGRKPVVFQATLAAGVLTLDPELSLHAALAAGDAFNAGAV
jgi:hypothetical protein